MFSERLIQIELVNCPKYWYIIKIKDTLHIKGHESDLARISFESIAMSTDHEEGSR